MGLILVISLTRGNVSSLIPPSDHLLSGNDITHCSFKAVWWLLIRGEEDTIADRIFVCIALISSGNFPWTGVFAARANKQNWNRVTARLHSQWDNTKREVLNQIFLESAVALATMCVEELNFCCHVIRFVKSSKMHWKQSKWVRCSLHLQSRPSWRHNDKTKHNHMYRNCWKHTHISNKKRLVQIIELRHQCTVSVGQVNYILSRHFSCSVNITSLQIKQVLTVYLRN